MLLTTPLFWYDRRMFRLGLMMLVLSVVGPFATQAYTVATPVVAEPYQVIDTVYNPDGTRVLLGTLTGYPVMYEFSTEEPLDIQVQLLQRYRSPSVDPTPFSLIMVREKDGGGGVAEIGRVRNGGAEGWQVTAYDTLGIDALTSTPLTASVTPGTYRVEVSAPTNQGAYALVLGSAQPSAGYFTTVSNISETQRHFGYSFFYILTSPYVYYPLGIVLLLVAIQRTWKLRHKITRKDVR